MIKIYTSYGMRVKHALLENQMSVKELARIVGRKLGRGVDPNYISKMLTGKKTSKPIRLAIDEVLELED